MISTIWIQEVLLKTFYKMGSAAYPKFLKVAGRFLQD